MGLVYMVLDMKKTAKEQEEQIKKKTTKKITRFLGLRKWF
jgi:hypothetical protein